MAVPLDPPLQDTFCAAVAVLIAVGCVIVKSRVVEQPILSVTVQVQTPGVKPVTETVPSPVGVPGVQL